MIVARLEPQMDSRARGDDGARVVSARRGSEPTHLLRRNDKSHHISAASFFVHHGFYKRRIFRSDAVLCVDVIHHQRTVDSTFRSCK